MNITYNLDIMEVIVSIMDDSEIDERDFPHELRDEYQFPYTRDFVFRAHYTLTDTQRMYGVYCAEALGIPAGCSMEEQSHIQMAILGNIPPQHLRYLLYLVYSQTHSEDGENILNMPIDTQGELVLDTFQALGFVMFPGLVKDA
jgi:hypothetical protein